MCNLIWLMSRYTDVSHKNVTTIKGEICSEETDKRQEKCRHIRQSAKCHWLWPAHSREAWGLSEITELCLTLCQFISLTWSKAFLPAGHFAIDFPIILHPSRVGLLLLSLLNLVTRTPDIWQSWNPTQYLLA